MSFKQTNQGGAILSFIIIAICLAIGVIGTVYIVQTRGEQAKRDQAIALADKVAEQDKQNAVDAAETGTDEVINESTSASNTDTVTETEPTTSPATDTNTGSSDSSQSELPQTGPADTLLTIVAVGVLAGVSVSYARSRLALTRSL